MELRCLVRLSGNVLLESGVWRRRHGNILGGRDRRSPMYVGYYRVGRGTRLGSGRICVDRGRGVPSEVGARRRSIRFNDGGIP
jgi:hypothetical protein